MDDFLEIVKPYGVPATIAIVVIPFIVLLVIALKTGREMSLGPFKIGGRVAKEKPEEVEQRKVISLIKPTVPIIGVDEFLNQVIHDQLIRKQTLKLIHKLKDLETTKNRLFQEAIAIDFNEFLTEVHTWTESSVRIQGSENDNFLIKLYRVADESVFSTCIMDYFSAWNEDFSEKLLEAHLNNTNCQTTRVFIFHHKEDVTDEAMALMRKQLEYNITPMMLIDKKREFDDFTLIDHGKVLGVTNEMKFDKRLTTWYFEEEVQVGKYMNMREIILNRASRVRN